MSVGMLTPSVFSIAFVNNDVEFDGTSRNRSVGDQSLGRPPAAPAWFGDAEKTAQRRTGFRRLIATGILVRRLPFAVAGSRSPRTGNCLRHAGRLFAVDAGGTQTPGRSAA